MVVRTVLVEEFVAAFIAAATNLGRLHAAGPAVTRSDVRLHANDRLDATLLRLLQERPCAEQTTVVRQRDRRHLEFPRATDQVFNPVRAIQERVFTVRMQMDE